MAAGAGSRFGALKQFEPLGDRRVVDWSLTVARSVVDHIVLVVPQGHDFEEVTADAVVAGGATRSASVRAGLVAVPDEATTIVVHDAARPRASVDLWRSVIACVEAGGCDGAVPVVPLRDTLRRRSGEPIDRDDVLAVQTPQAFRADALRRAHLDEPEGTDDASLVEAAGGTVALVDGEPDNLKITSPSDLAMMAVLFR